MLFELAVLEIEADIGEHPRSAALRLEPMPRRMREAGSSGQSAPAGATCHLPVASTGQADRAALGQFCLAQSAKELSTAS